MFGYAVECEYIVKNPVRWYGLNTTPGKTLPFTDDEVARMLGDPFLIRTPQLRAVVLTFLFTGLRISDVTGLQLSDLKLDERRLVRRTEKRGKMVALAIHPELFIAIRAWLSHRTPIQCASSYVFCTSTGRPLTPLDHSLRRMFKRCGIVGGHPHRFRDTFAVRLLAQGASLYDVAKLLGISVKTAELHYAPYVKELQDRATRLIGQLAVPVEKVVQFCSPLSTTLSNFGRTSSEESQPGPARAGSGKS